MVAHLDAVTSLAVDPNGLYLMSGSKYLVSVHVGLFDCLWKEKLFFAQLGDPDPHLNPDIFVQDHHHCGMGTIRGFLLVTPWIVSPVLGQQV